MTDRQAIPLSELLSRSSEIAQIQPDESYKEITVKLWGKGVVLRGIVSGVQLNGSRRFIARRGQLILSRIDARNGAIGMVPDSLDGAVVSTDFPLFRLEANRVLPDYFEWLTKTKPFVQLCQRASEGTTNRVRLQEDRFLNLQITLPPLPEQRRIVARIEELAAKINEARALRQVTIEESERLLVCMAHRHDLNDAKKAAQGWQRILLRDVMEFVDDSHRVKADSSFPNLGIYSFGRGLFHKLPIDGALTSATTLRRVRKGHSFIAGFSRLKALTASSPMNSMDTLFPTNTQPLIAMLIGRELSSLQPISNRPLSGKKSLPVAKA